MSSRMGSESDSDMGVDPNDVHDEGYNAGYEDGYEAGHEDGYHHHETEGSNYADVISDLVDHTMASIKFGAWKVFKTREGIVMRVLTLLEVAVAEFAPRHGDAERAMQMFEEFIGGKPAEKPTEEWVMTVVHTAQSELARIITRDPCANCDSPYCSGEPSSPMHN